LLSALIVLPAILGGCLEPARERLRVGVNAWPPFELLYLAQEKGFLHDAGVEVDLLDFSSYTGILRAYHQGHIDAFFATLNEALILDNFQDPPAVVLVADYSYGGDALVVGDGIAKLGDLRGRKIAFEESALGSYVLERALSIGGIEEKDVLAINRLPEEGEADFREGRVDAVITYQPALGRLLREPGARVLFSSRDLPGEIVDVLVVRRTLLSDRSDEVRRLLQGWFRAADLLRQSPGEAAPTMAARERTSVEDFLASLEGAHIPDLEENRRLLGSPDAPGTLHATAERIGEFLVRRGLARRIAAPAEVFQPGPIGSL
jgi:NitT/TauT family transport system substrate-binding protein